MDIRTDIYWESINKFGEELCGDSVELVRCFGKTIFVMADGLGSGVKANILSTLTTKIAATMLKGGASIEDTVKTIVSTLPVCKIRKIAYSTFTIIVIDEKCNCYIVEYDNPPVFLLRNGKIKHLNGMTREIAGKLIKETHLKAEENDMLIAVSDGVVHAGVGGLLNLGWQWENIAAYIEKISKTETAPRNIARILSTVTSNFYMERAGDDATIAAIKIIRPRRATIFAGPPQNMADDEKVVKILMESPGKKVVCGGTAAGIVSRILKRELVTSTEFIDPDVPPAASIQGIDLVTEGVLTLARARQILRQFVLPGVGLSELKQMEKKDGASRLAKLLADATDLTFLLGKAVNPAHQNPDFPGDLSIKLNIVRDIIVILEKMGKNVNVMYF
ncbi:MAG: serine/threonine-protein phosphatase [Tepidanaerobacteraceae bacterium]|nr:serine/threonine-protein phosphatase [Tepidanaerobacteraceae bacterium]